MWSCGLFLRMQKELKSEGGCLGSSSQCSKKPFSSGHRTISKKGEGPSKSTASFQRLEGLNLCSRTLGGRKSISPKREAFGFEREISWELFWENVSTMLGPNENA